MSKKYRSMISGVGGYSTKWCIDYFTFKTKYYSKKFLMGYLTLFKLIIYIFDDIFNYFSLFSKI